MQSRPPTSLPAASDATPTVAALAVIAFIVADLMHEVVGHGIGFFLAGGRTGIFTTTRLIETQRLGDRGGDIFDLGGPAGNIACAFAAWALQHQLRTSSPQVRLLLWLAMAFSLFWAFGYLLFCGVFSKGDWLPLVRGWPALWLWRVCFVMAGLALYRWAIRFLSAEFALLQHTKEHIQSLVLTSYLAGGVIACTGATFDPRGPFEILNSGALSSFGAAVGLLAVPRLLRGPTQSYMETERAIGQSYPWILVGALAAFFYIAVLGPGISFRF